MESRTRSLVVVRNDRLVLERYAPGWSRRRAHYSASAAKGVVGGLGAALLLDEGRIALDDRAATYVPGWRDAPLRSEITLRQLASHTSGLEDAETHGLPHDELGGWKGRFWARGSDPSPVHVALEDAPLLFPPGQGFAYSNPGFAVLSLALASAARAAPEGTLRGLLRERLLRPIGVEDEAWSIGYREPFRVQGTEVWAAWGGASFTADALARVGRLLLRRGDWEGERVLGARTIETIVTPAPRPERREWSSWPAGAVGWWTNRDGTWPRLPRDAFLASGAGHQILLVVPSLELVVVRLGERLGEKASTGFWAALESELIEPLMTAFPAPPRPRSEALPGAWFEPLSSVVCRARGSDNWPITWGPDGALYTAYGDGWGFEPRVSEKLSNGFARVTGAPPDFRGANLRAPSGERRGDGPEGGKASGILWVDGVLYMLMRNLGNARLAWSEDGGRTWTWGFRFEESFGSPTFLQFGPDYADARDGYVYVYSQDGASAYEADDRVVLARAPRDRLRERAAWEFYAGRASDGSPRFSASIREREAVLEHPGHCARSEVVYDAGLGRYLMALGYDLEGGWGLFEAPEPWGPWRTVYHTTRWDVGATHSYRIPTAWIRDGGRTLHVVYSGTNRADAVLDAFCVRALRIPALEPGAPAKGEAVSPGS